MYMYVQARVQERKYGHVCVQTGGVSNAYSRIRTARARVHGWVGTEKQTSCSSGGNRLGRNTSCSSGANWLGWNSRWKQGLAYRRTEETALCSTGHVQNGGPVDREGCGVPQNGGNGPPTVETGVLLIGRGVVYRKTEETDLLRSKQGSC